MGRGRAVKRVMIYFLYNNDTMRYILHMNVKITYEIRSFLDQHKVSARRLALEAGVTPVIVTRVLSGERKDMLSSNADALREAMSRLSLISAQNSPNQNHVND